MNLLLLLVMAVVFANTPKGADLPDDKYMIEEKRTEYCDIRWYEGPNSETKYGEKFDVNGYTFASNSLPYNTEVDITYNGVTLHARCNDRGPNRVELTRGAFAKLADLKIGILRKAKVQRTN